MGKSRRTPDDLRLLANVAGAVLAVTLINILVVWFGWNTNPSGIAGRFLPDLPDWLVGLVWTCLFAMLGAARWRLGASSHPAAAQVRRWLVGLMAMCCAYPLYTGGLQNPVTGFAGNITTMAVAAVIAVRMRPINLLATVAPCLVICWLVFATFYIADEMRWWW